MLKHFVVMSLICFLNACGPESDGKLSDFIGEASAWAKSRVSLRDADQSSKVVFVRTSPDQGVVSGSDGFGYLMYGIYGTGTSRRQVYLVDRTANAGLAAYLAKWQVVSEGGYSRYSVIAKLVQSAPSLASLVDSKGWINVGSLEFASRSSEAVLKLSSGLQLSLVDSAADRPEIVGSVAIHAENLSVAPGDPLDERGMYSLSCNTLSDATASRSALTCRQIPAEFDLCAAAPLSAECRIGRAASGSFGAVPESQRDIDIAGFDPTGRGDGSVSLAGDLSGKIIFHSDLNVSTNGAIVDCENRLVVKATGIDGRVNPVCKFQLAPVLTSASDGRLACAVHVHFQGAATAADKICNVSAQYLGDATQYKTLRVVQP